MKKDILRYGRENFWQLLLVSVTVLGIILSIYYSTFGDPLQNLLDGVLFDSTRRFIPCDLCWLNRVIFFPSLLTIIYSIYYKDYRVLDLVKITSIAGLMLSIYHHLLQSGIFETSVLCYSGKPCNVPDVLYLGFITIPLLGSIGYILQLVSVTMIQKISS